MGKARDDGAWRAVFQRRSRSGGGNPERSGRVAEHAARDEGWEPSFVTRVSTLTLSRRIPRPRRSHA